MELTDLSCTQSCSRKSLYKPSPTLATFFSHQQKHPTSNSTPTPPSNNTSVSWLSRPFVLDTFAYYLTNNQNKPTKSKTQPLNLIKMPSIISAATGLMALSGNTLPNTLVVIQPLSMLLGPALHCERLASRTRCERSVRRPVWRA